jgi:hypothetical protein
VATATVEAGKGVLPATFMGGGAHFTTPVPRLVRVEMVESLFSAPRQRTVVAMMGVKAVVDVAVKAGAAVEPGASPNKQPPDKPVGPIVPVGSAVIRGIVEVTIRTDRRNADFDSNLGGPQGCTTEQCNGEN